MILLLLLLASAPSLHFEGEPLKFTSLAQGVTSHIEEPRTAVIRNPSEWMMLWKEHAPEAKPPAVDFTQSMVIAVFSGMKSTAAHAVAITHVDDRQSEIVVTYRETVPGPGDIVAQVLTYPFHIVRTDVRPGKVRFQHAR